MHAPHVDPVLAAVGRYEERIAAARDQLDADLRALYAGPINAKIAGAQESAEKPVEEPAQSEEPTLASAVRTDARKETWICPTCQRPFAAKHNLRRHESAHGHGSYAVDEPTSKPQGDRMDAGYSI